MRRTGPWLRLGLALALWLAPEVGRAQATRAAPSTRPFPVPESAFPADLELDVFREHALQLQGGALLHTTWLYPLGWSRTGRFGYVLEREPEASDESIVEVYVQDLRDDRVLWTQRELTPKENTGGGGRRQLTRLWALKGRAWSNELRAHGIAPAPRSTFQRGAPGRAADAFRLQAKLKPGPRKNDFGVACPTLLTVELEGRPGRKVLHQQEYPCSELGIPLDAEILGFLQSPFEDRIAVVLGEVHRGWEGPPHTVRLRIIGASLSKGFPRR